GSLIAASDLTQPAISSGRRYLRQKNNEIETSARVILKFHPRVTPKSNKNFGRRVFIFVTSSTQSNHNSLFIMHSESELITSSRKPSYISVIPLSKTLKNVANVSSKTQLSWLLSISAGRRNWNH